MRTNEKIAMRTEEILNQITAFQKDKFSKQELIDELLKLQEELRNIVYNDEHAKNANLRIGNVANQLEILNKERGNIADEAVTEVVGKCKEIGNQISALISGVTGEKKAFYSLLNMNCKKKILQNIELSGNGITTEIDDVVITKKGLFLIEVKNTTRNILIDENGNYYREGEVLSLDCRVAEKMNYKEQLLKETLNGLGRELKVHSIVVFTNSSIQVRNYYKYIRHCFLGQLPHIIEDYPGEEIFSDKDMEDMAALIEAARCYEKYAPEVDFESFKIKFAGLLAVLELGEEREEIQAVLSGTKMQEKNKKGSILWKQKAFWAGIVIGIALGCLIGFVINH